MTNPATGEVTAQLALASEDDVNEVVAAALAAFPRWRDMSLTRRTQILFAFRELLNARKKELAAIITSEHGKVLSDALGEVTRGQEVVEFACGIPHLIKGGFTENASTKVDVHSTRQPLGVVGIISPFNFPAMVPMWFFPIAIAAGNTVVLKPSEKVPTAALWVAELWKEAGLPDGVFNVLNGDKVAVDGLLTHPTCSRSRSSDRPQSPGTSTRPERPTASACRLWAVPRTTCWCCRTPISILPRPGRERRLRLGGRALHGDLRVLAVGDIGDELVAKIKERTVGLRTGDGTRGCDMGHS